ncbi:BMP family ABC transporter substrate-binding protein [Hoeflea prorocentri]|uniref:BMP family ABC transporter substrate-binding protein n=1 Tax=Hoeflea prorocentri TaxID=1922333 RepID=A0A9X3ZFT8_9HYPH|nr:BMP family ABC transporter substrate-binding protein [Hoeflea prorocentri]MCY6380082.1 BMP family ABC transporter substrate-binding protein [Hoeflea prorocentri]MDA5397882.1 BMP family ABC transporter substrate-binding protein [Hoeflea prorocentri]
MQNQLKRRTFLKTSLAAAAATTVPFKAHAADALKMGVVLPSPVADVGWSHTLMDGVNTVKEAYGDKIEVTVLENIAEGPDADRIANGLVGDGNTVLLLGSFGYQNGGMQIARRRPDVSIIHASGFMTAPNFSPFTAKYWQGTYLMGMAAASLSKTKKLGCVAAFAIPELITSINAFMLGAKSVDPDTEVSVVWVNSWFDPASEQEAAKALISQDVDVIFSNAQDTPSVISVAEEAGVYAFNLNSSMKSYAPSKYLGVVGTDWGPHFKRLVDAHVAGNYPGENFWLGMEDDIVYTADWNADIPADAVAAIEARQKEIRDGSFVVFKGPLVDQSGTERFAEGTAMSDGEILGMDWHVAGVTTPLPS